jgi:hypothetical protein
MKHELIRPRFIITEGETNKQRIDLSKSFNHITDKGGKYGFHLGLGRKGSKKP